VGVMFVSRCIGCAGQCDGSEKQGTVHRVGIRGKLVSFQGLDQYAMLEGVGSPKSGIGMCIVK